MKSIRNNSSWHASKKIKFITPGLLVAFVTLCSLFVLAHHANADDPTMSDYTAFPAFLSSSPKPNVIILLDNSGSMFNFAYNHNGYSISEGFDPNQTYSGYFDPDSWYTYSSNKVQVTGAKASRAKAANEWDGNFMNWLTMRRVDIARQVVIGGKCASRSLAGNPHDLIAEKPDGTYRGYRKRVTNAENYTPFSGTETFYFDTGNGTATFGDSSSHDRDYSVKVALSYEPTGVIQAKGDDVRWGLAFYNRDQGGYISKEVNNDLVSSMVTAIENTRPSTWTPMAESLWTITGYVAQDSTTNSSTGPRYSNGSSYRVSAAADPYNVGTGGSPEYVWCAKCFVLVVTDGEPTQDRGISNTIAGYYPDYTDDSDPVPSWASDSFWNSNGSHYIDDVALWARSDVANGSYRDLRPDLPGNQNITSYFVYAAFGAASNDGIRLLQQAAKNGGFDDRNGNFLPDIQEEWDKDEDGVPDNYFQADNGDELAESLEGAITDILRRTSSGTSVSIISTSSQGEGAMFQAYFKPEEITTMGADTYTTNWVGFLHGLWVDDLGNFREDNGDARLIYEDDDIIEFFLDEELGTFVRRDNVSEDDPYGDGSWDLSYIPMREIGTLWEAGKKLALSDPSERNIFTSLDGSTHMEFTTSNASSLKYYLRADTDAKAQDIISFIRGEEVAGMRSRQVFLDTDGDTITDTEATWKLGDIVFSTPTVVGRPMENYDEIYSDPSFRTFEEKYTWNRTSNDTSTTDLTVRPRPSVVYVGANDGMLHAINAGMYIVGDDPDTSETEHGYYSLDYPDYYTTALGYAPGLGEEIWAFIPYNLLPHLQWLADPNYTHVYYVDLKPKIVDARLWGAAGDDVHTMGWGTILIGGLRLGGAIYETEDFDLDGTNEATPTTFSSCYFAIDITNPGDPQLLWEFTDADNLGQSTGYPAVFRTGDNTVTDNNWYVVFGSGVTDIQTGTSDQQSSIYVLDLKTGAVVTAFGPAGGGTFTGNQNDSFMGGAATMDMNVDYQANAVYIGQSWYSGGWNGQMLRLLIAEPGAFNNTPAAWGLSVLAQTKADQPITAAPGLSIDSTNTPWVFWGTGRYMIDNDRMTMDTQSFYGVKDRTLPDGTSAENIDYRQLFDVSDVVVTYDEDGTTVSGNIGVNINGMTWEEMREAMRGSETQPTYGWYFDVTDITGSDNMGERVLEKPSVFAGMVMFPSFKPIDDICGFGGQSRLYAVYYETGTSYKEHIFMPAPEGAPSEVERSIEIGTGRSSSPTLHVGRTKVEIIVQQSTSEIWERTMQLDRQKSGGKFWFGGLTAKDPEETLTAP